MRTRHVVAVLLVATLAVCGPALASDTAHQESRTLVRVILDWVENALNLGESLEIAAAEPTAADSETEAGPYISPDG